MTFGKINNPNILVEIQGKSKSSQRDSHELYLYKMTFSYHHVAARQMCLFQLTPATKGIFMYKIMSENNICFTSATT